MPTVLPMTRVEAYLAYKAGVIAESDLKPSLKTNFYSGLEHWLAYWCGLTSDYPKDKNNDPKWYTEEEYYVAYLCGIAPDYPVNCYRRVGAYLRYIISARWGRPEKPLTREEYYLSLMSAPYLPPNDPASIISIDDTAEAPFGDLKIYGDSFQQTYTGKSILGNTVDAIKAIAANNGTWSGNAYTKNGVTYTLNVNNGTIESISLSGTASANSNLFLTDDTLADFLTKVQEGQNYTLSGCPSGGSPTTYYLCVQEQPYRQLFTDTGDSLSKSMPTLSSGATAVRLVIGIDSGTDTTGLVYKPMFESGLSPTSFEPYVGGIAAPNPDYPQAIQVVTGEQTVKVTGKNLIDYDNRSINHVWNSSYEFVSSGVYDTSPKIDCVGGSTITMSRTSATGYFKWVVMEFASDGTPIARQVNPGSTENVWTVTLSNNAAYCYIGWRNDILGSGNIMAELGSTATGYEPYQSQSYHISLGSLELAKIGDYQDYIWTDGEKWWKHKAVGKTVINGASALVYNSQPNTTSSVVRVATPELTPTSDYLANLFRPNMSGDDRLVISSRYKNVVIFIRLANSRTGAVNGDTASVVPAFQSWLTSNEVVCYSRLATPTDEEITDATLISQLNALLEGGSYNYQTNIVVSAADPNLPGLLQVTAAKY